MHFFVRTALNTAALGSALLAATAQAATPALPANLDGSAGLSGWQALGDVAVVTGTLPQGASLGSTPAFVLGTATTFDQDDHPFAPGTFSISHGTEPLYDTELSQVETSLGLAPGTLGAQAYEGSALTRSLQVTAGTTVSFQWRAMSRTPDAALGSEDDSLWFTVQGGGAQVAGAPVARLSTLFAPQDTRNNGWLDSGWRTSSWTASQDGTLTLGWAVVDEGSTTGTTVLAIHGLSVTPSVPEPGTWALALSGLALVGWLRRKA